MSYIIGDQTFRTKGQLTERCRTILSATPEEAFVNDSDMSFLLALFQHHDEWATKSAGGVRAITKRRTLQGTSCFYLLKHDGSAIDISYPSTIRLVTTSRSADLLPQALLDFRGAARHAIQEDVFAFRDANLTPGLRCPLTGEPVDRSNYSVDHVPPDTFDRLLFSFCRENAVDPLQTCVNSQAGTVPVFEDGQLALRWIGYHREHAKLRLTSKLGNLGLPKQRVPWNELWA